MKAIMNWKAGSVGGLVLLVALFFAINILADIGLRGMQIDLTENRLYTLSKGTKNILHGVEEPITLTLYFSESTAAGRPNLQSYGKRVRELLEQYERESRGKVKLRVVDPEPFSEGEDEARAANLAAIPIGAGGEELYFGLLGVNSTDGREVIRFFDPSDEPFLEYQLTRLVYNLANPQRKTIGVISSLPLDGGMSSMPMMQQQPQQPWAIMREIRSLFDVEMLTPDTTEIPENVDVLLIVHLKQPPNELLRAIDRFVIGGGPTVIFEDPLCEADIPPGAEQNPMMVMQADRSSSLNELLESWGLTMADGQVAADMTYAMSGQDPGGGGVVPYIHYLRLNQSALNPDDVVTGQLGMLQLAAAGVLEHDPSKGTEWEPLITTSDNCMVLDAQKVSFFPQPKELINEFVSRAQPLTLAGRLTGTAKSVFAAAAERDAAALTESAGAGTGTDENTAQTDEEGANGTESGEGQEETATAQSQETEDEQPETEREGQDADQEPETPTEGQVNVIVVADVDMLIDYLWMEEMRLGNMVLGYQKRSNNADFLVNALDQLSGSSDLMALRARGTFARPFTLVEKIRREAEQKYLAEQQRLVEKQRETERKLQELQRARPDTGSLILTPEQQAELDRFQEELATTNSQLRQVQYNLRKDVERLGIWLKAINIGAAPLLVAIAAVGLGMYRSMRRRADRRAMAGQG